MTRLAVIALAILCLTNGTSVLHAADEKPAASTIAVFELHGELKEQTQSDDPLLGSIGGESLHSLVTRLEKAKTDDTIAAVVVLMNSFSVSTSQIEELRQAMNSVKEKKPVYAHADSASTRTYALLSSASRLSISPTGDLWINGLAMEGMYVRGLLDMLSVQPDFLTCGNYKSAAETFMRKEPSPEADEMQNWLLDSVFETTVNIIAANRSVEPDQVKSWINQGLYSAETALSAKLIDAVESREALLAFLKEKHGATIKLDKTYGKKTINNVDLENPFGVMQLWAQLLNNSKPTKSTKNAVAVVYVNGPIMLGKPEPSLFGGDTGAHSETIRKALDKVADEPRVRAVVLRVDSPGGSATASEIILQAVRNVQTSKPVIVSMGSVAASGGYYVASRGERIFADRGTITGSIGVVAGKLATSNMWNRIGVHFKLTQRGERAGMMQSPEPWTDAEKKELQKWMDDIYGVFKSHVVEGRKDKLTKPIDEISGGRVYTGAQALELGLIDEIGTLHDAIAFAAKTVELDSYDVRSYPEKKNFLEQLLDDLGSKKESDRRISTGLWSAVTPALESLDPEHVSMLRQALLQLDHLQQDRVMLTAPVLRVMDR